jgi:hypothetical protein
VSVETPRQEEAGWISSVALSITARNRVGVSDLFVDGLGRKFKRRPRWRSCKLGTLLTHVFGLLVFSVQIVQRGYKALSKANL